MSSALTREYSETKTSESKTSLEVKKLNHRKRDSEVYQNFVTERFSFGFRFWTKFIAVFGDIFCIFSFLVSNRTLRSPPRAKASLYQFPSSARLLTVTKNKWRGIAPLYPHQVISSTARSLSDVSYGEQL